PLYPHSLHDALPICVGSTWRSSPKNNCILSQGSCPRSASLASRAYSAFGVEPPERETLKEPLVFAAVFADFMNSSAARLAMAAASCRIRTSAFAQLSLMRCRQIGRASCRERVVKAVVGVAVEK